MKAIILKAYGSADNFEMTDMPVPPIKKGEVRIKIKAVSFNPVDYQVRKGLPESRMVISKILGRDLSGIVDAVHEDVTDFKEGDEVYCYVCNLASSGTYVEYVSVPQELVAKKPALLSYEEAAAVPVAAITAMLALTRAGAERAGSVFIAGGAGGVGSFTIMFAQHLGIEKIITTAGNEKSRSYLVNQLHLKEEQVIDYKQPGFIQQAIERNGGYFDVAIDLVGDKMLAACCALISIDGNVASVVDAPGKDSFETLFQKNASFHSIGANAYSFSDDRNQWLTYRRMLNYFSKLYDSNQVMKPSINVLGTLSTAVVIKAHQLLENSSVQGKLVMSV
jgi:NADPH2:quinone reductase